MRLQEIKERLARNEHIKSLGNAPTKAMFTHADQDALDIEYLINRIELYEKAFKYADKAIYTQHCTMNHMENTEHEEGQISGLIQASRIVEKARLMAEEALKDE